MPSQISLNYKKENSSDILFQSTQKYLNIFVFFSVFPLIKIFGVSITFFIFMIIVFKFLKQKKKLFIISQWTDIYLLLFLFFVFISWIFSEETFRERNNISIFKFMLQYSYWIILALFIKTWIYKYNFFTLSKYFFYGAIASSFFYVFLNSYFKLFPSNAFAYVMVTVMPISYYYLMKKYGIMFNILVGIGFLIATIISQSRAGTVFILFELMLIFSLGNKKIRKLLLMIIPLFIILFIYITMGVTKADISSYKLELADLLEDTSPKIAHTLRLEENVFNRDKSWLVRELMWQKGKRIFNEHPFLGIGPGNFRYYYTSLDIDSVSTWLHKSEENYNTRSSQNSYIMILTESGIFAFILLMLVFLIIIIKGFYYIKTFSKEAKFYIYLPFLTLLFYAFILVTSLGTLFWLLLGLSLTLIERKKELI